MIKTKTFKVIETILIIAILMIPFISFGVKEKETPTISIENKLEKYINYNLSEEDKGTLVQYAINIGIEGKENIYPIKESEISIKFDQIDGKYPYAVKTIIKSTKLTNGKTFNLEDKCEYNSTTGNLIIKANNDNKDRLININDKDEYIVIGYYDTYIEEPTERQISLKIFANAKTFSNDNNINTKENLLEVKVAENIGELTSLEFTTDEIYNGYIKSNSINGTQYNTQYKELEKIRCKQKRSNKKHTNIRKQYNRKIRKKSYL